MRVFVLFWGFVCLLIHVDLLCLSLKCYDDMRNHTLTKLNQKRGPVLIFTCLLLFPYRSGGIIRKKLWWWFKLLSLRAQKPGRTQKRSFIRQTSFLINQLPRQHKSVIWPTKLITLSVDVTSNPDQDQSTTPLKLTTLPLCCVFSSSSQLMQIPVKP